MDKHVEKIIDLVIENEGGAKVTNDPLDAGGRTQYGIAEKFHPEAWADGKVTHDEARQIYFDKYVKGPGFDQITDQRIMMQMVDFGVNSGPFVATQKLQSVLGVKVDGKLGPATLKALQDSDQRVVNNSLVAERVKLLCKICVNKPSQLRFLNGWVNRALEFLV